MCFLIQSGDSVYAGFNLTVIVPKKRRLPEPGRKMFRTYGEEGFLKGALLDGARRTAETPMNHKKILSLMYKFNLSAKIRRADPYKQIAKATHKHTVCSNFLNREFEQDELGKVFVTDIPYLPNRSGQMAYLSP